jgi:hypothetical protein
MKRLFLLLPLFVICTSLLFAQDENGEDEWDVTEHLAETKQVSFETTEGTWMNLDVSPDGEKIVFDLLGNIYVMPIEGGRS